MEFDTDRGKMPKNSKDDANLIQEAYNNYKASIPEKIKKIDTLIQKLKKNFLLENIDSLYFEIHKIAGSAGMYGFSEISNLCKDFKETLHEWQKTFKKAKTEKIPQKQQELLDDFFKKLLIFFGKEKQLEIEKSFVSIEQNETTSKKATLDKKLDVFILDDDPDIIALVSYAFQKKGLSVQTAGSLKELFDAFEKMKNLPRLVIIDRLLPDGDGLEGYVQLRKIYKNFPPVLFLTKLSAESDILKGLEKGASDYITKPFSLQVLMEKSLKLLQEEP